MGKGEIKSGGEDGLYTVELLYSEINYSATMSALDAKIADLTAKYNAFPVDLTKAQEREKKIVLLSKLAMEKRKASLQSSKIDDSEKTIDAWCADFTEDLTGIVGTVEVPGEKQLVQIRPAFEGRADYSADRDGQLQQLTAMDYAGVYYNLAMLPGWQKWRPTYRYGTISNIDESTDTCDVALDYITSTQQGLGVNQSSSLSNVTVEYMDCNAKAFEDGDEVLVMFDNYDWNLPKVIGFKENPKPCFECLIYVTSNVTDCFVWDLERNKYVETVTNNAGEVVENWPVSKTSISNWVSQFTKKKTVCINYYSEDIPEEPEEPVVGVDDCIADQEKIYLQDTAYKKCIKWSYVVDCQWDQTENGVTDYVTNFGEINEYQSSAEDFFLYERVHNRYFPFGKENDLYIGFGATTTAVDNPVTVMGKHSLTQDTEYTDEIRYNPEEGFVEPCTAPGWIGEATESYAYHTWRMSSPFDVEAVTLCAETQVSKNRIYRLWPDDLDTFIVEKESMRFELYNDEREISGVIGSQEDETPFVVGWYRWKYVVKTTSESCEGSGSTPEEAGCTLSGTEINNTTWIDEFKMYSEKAPDTDSGDVGDPRELNPLEMPENTALAGAVDDLLGESAPLHNYQNLSVEFLVEE